MPTQVAPVISDQEIQNILSMQNSVNLKNGTDMDYWLDLLLQHHMLSLVFSLDSFQIMLIEKWCSVLQRLHGVAVLSSQDWFIIIGCCLSLDSVLESSNQFSAHVLTVSFQITSILAPEQPLTQFSIWECILVVHSVQSPLSWLHPLAGEPHMTLPASVAWPLVYSL